MNGSTYTAATQTHKTQSRKHEITVCSVLLCLCVLFIHGASNFISSGDKSSLLYLPVAALWRMSGFAAQGFVFLAGLRYMLSAAKGAKSVPRYYISRLLRILPLYLIWCALYYAYDIVAEGASFDLGFFLRSLMIGDLACHLYYIPLILQFTLLAPISMLLRKRVPAEFILPVSLLLTSIFGDHLTDILSAVAPNTAPFAYSDRVFTSFLIFWSAGCCAGAAYERFAELLDRARPFIIAAFFISAAMDLGAMYYSFILGRFIWCVKQIQTLYVLCAIMFVMTLSRAIVKNRAEAPVFFEKAELAGYFIYVSHVLILDVVQLLLSKLQISAELGLGIRMLILALWFVLCTLAQKNKLYMVHAKRKLSR